METITVLLTGHMNEICQAGWLKETLQKLLDQHDALEGTHLRVRLVDVTIIDREGKVHRAQAKAG